MNIFQNRQVERFARAAQFVDANTSDFAPTSQVLAVSSDLKAAIEVLQTTAPEAPKAPVRNTSASAKKAALGELRAELVRISDTANALQKRDPKFKNTFALPDKRRKDELASAAKQFVKDATPLKARFVDFELNENFLDTLTAKLEAYQSAQAPQAARPKAAKKAAADTSGPFAKASELMEVLDTVVRNKYAGNADLLDAWKQASSLNTPRRRRKGEAQAESEEKPVRRGRRPKNAS